MNHSISLHAENPVEVLSVPQNVSYNWTYDSPRRRLARLYENAKRDQWNASERIDWTVDVDPERGLVPDAAIGIFGTEIWNQLDARQIERLRHEMIAWQLCQFLHGEQGALLATAQIVDAVPWYDAKMYGATQVMDEARHVEVYRRFIQEKLGSQYEVNPELKSLLDQILTDSRWDMKFLGMQIIVEGLALAAFGTIRDTSTNTLLRDLTAYVMEDEARHVAFGVLSLREYCRDLPEKDKHEREDFVYEGFYASVSRDGAPIHLKCAPKLEAERSHRKSEEHLDAYMAVAGVRELYEELTERGAPIVRPLEERPWGVVDFYIEDPDGYILCFAEGVEHSRAPGER